MPFREYEAIVIGSGATGGIAALTLAQSGIKVLIIEAGRDLNSSESNGAEPCNTFLRLKGLISGDHKNQSQHPGYWKSNPLLYINENEHPYTTPSDKPFIWTRGNQVGGRSLTWGGITLRLSDDEFKASRIDGYGPEWPIYYSELEEHYSSIEKLLSIHGNKDGLDHLPDGEYIAPLPFTQSEKFFANEVKVNMQLPLIHSRGFGPHAPSVEQPWPRFSSNGSTIPKAIATGNVEILSNHMVESLLINKEDELARGVVVVNQTNGLKDKIYSKLIIVCSSTIQTIRLLLSSSEKFGGDLIEPSGLLGCNLMDHVSLCRFFAIDSKSDQETTTYKSGAQTLSGAGSFFIPLGSRLIGKKERNFLRGYGIWGGIDRFDPPGFLKRYPETCTGFLIAHGEVLPNKSNKVTLSEKTDKWGIPVPDIDCQWRDNEKNMIKHMESTIVEVIKAGGGNMMSFKNLFKVDIIEPVLNQALALQDDSPPPGYYIHEVGGAPMGISEGESVLDKWNRLWRCKNVLVTDGACWPTSGWQSPTLTMMAVTRRACLKAIKPPHE